MAILRFEYHYAPLISALSYSALSSKDSLQVRLLLLLLLFSFKLLLERGNLLLQANDLRRFLLELFLKAKSVLVVL
jgi:hypothetical protein